MKKSKMISFIVLAIVLLSVLWYYFEGESLEFGSTQFFGAIYGLKNEIERDILRGKFDAKMVEGRIKSQTPKSFVYVSREGEIVTINNENRLIILDPEIVNGKVEWNCKAEPLQSREKQAFLLLGCKSND